MLEWVAIVVPIVCTVVMALIGWGTTQAIGRLNDKINSVHSEVREHKELDHEMFNHHGNLFHWINNCLQRITLKMASEGKTVDLPERPER